MAKPQLGEPMYFWQQIGLALIQSEGAFFISRAKWRRVTIVNLGTLCRIKELIIFEMKDACI
jgi:hypothetical protein